MRTEGYKGVGFQSPSGDEDRLAEAILTYERAVDAGRPPDPEEFLACHPDLAEGLRDYFADEQFIAPLMAPLLASSGVGTPDALRETPSAPADTPAQREGIARGVSTTSFCQQGIQHYPFLAPPQAADELGRLGPFRVLRKLGVGGMGIVFEAHEPSLDRTVALKVMKPDLAEEPRARQRFLGEARAMARLRHPGIVQVHRVEEGGPIPFLAMPLLRGETLRRRLVREGALPRADVLRLGEEMAEGLAAAHAAGLVHRDIKPSNVWLEGEDPGAAHAVILDFGLMRREGPEESLLSEAGAIVGTVGYLSPEQARAQKADARSDLFSLGCVLYEMATGRPAFAGPDLVTTLARLATDNPPAPAAISPELPSGLSALIMDLLAKTPGGRPTSAGVVAESLRRFQRAKQGDEPEGEKAPRGCAPFAPPRGLAWQRRRALFAAGAVLALMGLSALMLSESVLPLRFGRPVPANPTVTPTLPPAALGGRIDLRGWRQVRGRMIPIPEDHQEEHEGLLLLKATDQYRVRAQVQPAAYLYAFEVNTRGQAVPLFPWRQKRWGTRPPDERPCTELELPLLDHMGYRVQDGEPGVVTLLLLAVEGPLPLEDALLQKLLEGLPKKLPDQDPRAPGVLEHHWEEGGDGRRARPHFPEEAINDPVVQLKVGLRPHLQPLRSFTTGVSFATQGE